MVFTYHNLFIYSSTSGHSGCFYVLVIGNNADAALEAGIPLFVTEWGSVNADGNGGVNDKSTQEWFEWIDKNQLSSCNWAINDKDEGSSIFVKDSEYSETGLYIKALIDERTKDAPWRK